MPAEMIVSSKPDMDGADFMIMLPNHAMAFEIDDSLQPSREILIVLCLRHDWGSDVFVVPEPDDYTDIEYMASTEVIESFCTENNHLTQLDGHTGLHVDVHDWSGNPLELLIGHNVMMSLS
jgi:hypothetical protein